MAIILCLGLTGCSNSIDLSADVEYRATDCDGLGHEFGRYLDADIRHIVETGEPRYFVARRRHPPVLREVLAIADTGMPEDEQSLLFMAPIGHIYAYGEAVRERGLACTADQLIASSDQEVSAETKAVLTGGIQHQPAGPARTWEDWWETHRSTAEFATQRR